MFYDTKEKTNDPIEEIGYWSKNWSLHNFIIQYWGNAENDNYVNIYLDEPAICKILLSFYKVNDFLFHEDDPLAYDYEPFIKALHIVRNGKVVFYLPSY